jgi:plasmid replication initiation protein
MSKLTVRQGNDLIEASYKIASLGEARLIRLLIAQISSFDEDFKVYQISVSDFAHVFGLNDRDGRLYELLYNAADGLTSRKIRMRNGNSWLLMNWLSSAEYRHGSGYVELCFDAKLKPYLLQLKGYYTEYELENTVHFKSLYSIRLFELLKREYKEDQKTGQFKRSFEYDELREKMGIEKDEYTFFKDFRVRVIDKAQKEINRFSSINIVQVDYPKTGRKITHVVFHYEKQKQGQMELVGASPVVTEKEAEPETPDDVRELVAMGIDEATAYKWRKKYGVKKIARNVAYTRAMQKANKIRSSLAGYLARAISEDIASGWEKEQDKKAEKAKLAGDAERQKAREDEERADLARERARAVLAAFWELPSGRQAQLRADYAASLSAAVIRKSWENSVATEERPESMPRHRGGFVIFLKTQGME